jgi:hypothetical protein
LEALNGTWSLASLRAKVEDAQVAASQAAQIVLAAKEAA